MAETALPRPRPGWGLTGGSAGAIIGKILVLACVAAIAVWLAGPLLGTRAYGLLMLLVLTTVAIFVVYLQPWHIPLKYIVPGTVFLIAFQVIPVVTTFSTAFTNFGDGHRGTKADAVSAIESGSVTRVPGSTDYTLTIASSEGVSGPLSFLVYDPKTKTVQRGDANGLVPLTGATVTPTGKVTAAPGLTILNAGQASRRSGEVQSFSVPTANGAIKAQGLSRAYEGKPAVDYDPACDCVTNTATGAVYTANSESGLFVDPTGNALSQGWQVNVGLNNFARAFTDPAVSGPFLSIMGWNFAFAIITVVVTFLVGLGVAMALNSPKLRGLRVYRILIVLPYAMPGFAMILVWRDMFNQDFGLVNSLTGVNINWFGEVWTARLAILLTQFWLGYPYMFLVCLGALQSIPADLTEAAAVDGARRYQAFRAVVFPLLLIAVAPLLISSFAFNFNNFNVVQLTTAGGPFPPDNPKAGGTDILVSYTYRLAFAEGGAQYGFAAAVSIVIFLIVAVVSIVGFRRTAALEEINR